LKSPFLKTLLIKSEKRMLNSLCGFGFSSKKARNGYFTFILFDFFVLVVAEQVLTKPIFGFLNLLISVVNLKK
jgi:hypothetical protein